MGGGLLSWWLWGFTGEGRVVFVPWLIGDRWPRENPWGFDS